jgi:predicted HTH transcriptional regulator
VERLVSGAATRATDIAAQFQRHEKTAKRDIAELVEKGVIEYVGARKNGVYRLKEQES